VNPPVAAAFEPERQHDHEYVHHEIDSRDVGPLQRLDDAVDHLLQLPKIAEQADGIEFRAFQRDAHAVVVPVDILALAFVAAQGVARGEGFVHCDFKHGNPA